MSRNWKLTHRKTLGPEKKERPVVTSQSWKTEKKIWSWKENVAFLSRI